MINNKKAMDDNYILNNETKLMYPFSNGITNRRKRKSIIDRLFKLKN